MKSAVKQRLMDFIKQKGISVREFERTCGLANGYVSTVVSGIGIDKIQRILDAYPEINPDWLLYGKGDMYIGENKGNVQNNIGQAHDNVQNNYNEKLLDLLKMQGEQLTIALRTIENLSKSK